MRRPLIFAAALVPLALAAPAAADYHSACPGGIGPGASVNLTAASGTFTYSGVVNCNGATSITINSLTLRRPDGTTVNAGSQSCSPCNQLTHSGSVPAGAEGDYVVTMSFTVVGAGRTFSPGRTKTWNWNGTNLVAAGGGGTPSPFDFCDGNHPIVLDHQFENDNSNLTDPLRMTIGGVLECHGADTLTITLLNVRRQGVSGNTLIGPLRSAPARTCSGCTVISTEASFPSDGPGRYRMGFNIAITKGGETRTYNSPPHDHLSAGFGPMTELE